MVIKKMLAWIETAILFEVVAPVEETPVAEPDVLT